MVRARAWQGITGFVDAIRMRWSSSHRWLRETVVWVGSEPARTWECTDSLARGERQGLETEPRGWQDTETQSFLFASPHGPLPLDKLPTMDHYPGLDCSTCVIEPGGTADARQADDIEACGVYTVGDPRSLIVIGSLRSAANAPVRSVRVAHWQDDTPMAEIDAFFERLGAGGERHGCIELCIVEGCDGSFRTPAVIDHAWRLGIYPCYHASVAPVFGIAADPHGRVYRGDSPGLKAFLETRYAGGAVRLGQPLHAQGT